MKIVINGETLSISGGGLPAGTVAIKPLTKAEYDALTDDEKNADVVYAITDDSGGGSSGGGSSEEVYSTEETRIGTWIDGKPLYRKGFILNQKLDRGAYDVVDITDLSVNHLIGVRGFYSSGSSNSGIVERAFPDTTFVVGLDSTKTHIRIYVVNSNDNTIHEFAIDYTKTTDEATS